MNEWVERGRGEGREERRIMGRREEGEGGGVRRGIEMWEKLHKTEADVYSEKLNKINRLIDRKNR